MLLRKPRARRLAVEGLEDRTLLSAGSTPDLAAMGEIARPRGVAAVRLSVAEEKFETGSSGRILFDVEVVADDGSRAVPASFRVLDERGRVVFAGAGRRDGTLSGRGFLREGDYTVLVRGQGSSTGSLVVLARMVGDVDGDHDVDASDTAAVREGLGAGRPRVAGVSRYDEALDLSGDGRITRRDLALGGLNLGASARKVKLLVNLDADAQRTLGNGNLYVAYIVTSQAGTQQYLNKYGILVPVKGTDNTVIKGGAAYAEYSTALSDPLLANGIDVDADIAMGSTRIWLSANSPIYFRVLTQGNDPNGPVTGFVQPSVTNPSDVNFNTVFDFQEFSLSGGNLHGNLTQVDMFGLPMTLQYASGSGATARVGIEQYRDVVLSGLAGFLAGTPIPADLRQGIIGQGSLRALSVKDYLSPFPDRQAALSYFQPTIDALWAKYAAGTGQLLRLSTTRGGYTGQVTADGLFTFTPTSGGLGTVKVEKPTSWNVFASNGPLAPGNDEHGALAAQIAAALNRGTALLDASRWADPKSFYPAAGPANYYAQYWHTVSLGGLAYGFDFDDVGGQSTLISMNDATQLTLTVRWDRPQ